MKKSDFEELPALFIGRFQPFHFGHLDALKQVFAKEKYVIICIGSAEDDYVPDNPFTSSERYQIIEAVLQTNKIPHDRFTIIPVRNIKHYSLWTRHVENLLPPFGNVYSGSPIVRRLFNADGIHKIVPVKINKPISATRIRQLMISGAEGEWEKFVPEEAVKLIKKWDGVGRLKEIKPQTKYK